MSGADTLGENTMMEKLLKQLKLDEGLVLRPYKDSRGVWTVGYGHNLEANHEPIPDAITAVQAERQLREDVQGVVFVFSQALPWTAKLDEARRGALLNMAFNMGLHGLLTFHRMLTALEDSTFPAIADKLTLYRTAAWQMKNSKWAKQVGKRAVRLATQMETGEWQFADAPSKSAVDKPAVSK